MDRLSVREPNCGPLPLPTGEETLEELREMILRFTVTCPSNQNHPHCPFRSMSTLSDGLLKDLVSKIPRENCLGLFELERQCRDQAETSGRPAREEMTP